MLSLLIVYHSRWLLCFRVFRADATLPVELTSFELLETRNDGITLQWITESEINNLGFNLDRKTPITDWSQIASYVTHPALQGQGSVSHQTIYTFTDNTVQENESYDYRLSMWTIVVM